MISGSSQFKPLPESEVIICRRISALRRFVGYTQSELATMSRVSRNQIANIESERVPLKAVTGWMIFRTLNANPFWIATSNGIPLMPEKFIDSIAPAPSDPVELFSSFYERVLVPRIQQFEAIAAQAFPKSGAPLPKSLWTKIEAFQDRSAQISAEIELLMVDPDLTSTSVFRKTADVRREFTLQKLLTDLRRLTDAPGMKAKLAEHLKVPQARVSEWLNGKYIPSGDITLELLNWVRSQERK